MTLLCYCEMKESIFFNSEQLKIIRWYNIIYQWVFKYWVEIAAWILSLLASWWIFASGYFSWIYLLEKQDEWTVSAAKVHYDEKAALVTSITWLEWKVLNWRITVNSWNLLAQDMLLVSKFNEKSSGLTLPRMTDVSLTDLEFFAKWVDQEHFSSDYMASFFHTVLMKPMSTSYFWEWNPALFPMNTSLKDLFWLGCTVTASKDSFVCKSYVKSFLNRFYFYDLSNAIDEVNQYYGALKSDYSDKDKMCEGLIMYGKYSETMDNRLSELFRSCWWDNYSEFILLRDFLALAKPFSVGYVESQAYTDPNINEYKLYSLQQMLYWELSNAADVKSTVQSYLEFVREVLIKEGSRKEELLSPFAKSFTYWYNMTILAPYFKDENSKMDKEDRTTFNSTILSLNYWDQVANFKGLQEQSRYVISVEEIDEPDEIFNGQSLREVFIQNYMPPNFSLFAIETWDDQNLLKVRGQDGATQFILEALLRYENLQLSVVNVKIDKTANEPNEWLTSYINSLIENTDTNYSLSQILLLMDQYKEFTETPTEVVNLCDQLEERYPDQLVSCEDSIIEMIPMAQDEEGSIVYTFLIKDGVLTDIKVNNELLEAQLLNELDLSNIDAASTYFMIEKILKYKVATKETNFWLKDYLAVSEVINKYLWDVPITTENGEIKVDFSIWGVNFIGTYDMLTHELNPIALDFKGVRRPVTVQWFTLTLDEAHLEQLNEVKSDAKEYLKKINPALVNKYFAKK